MSFGSFCPAPPKWGVLREGHEANIIEHSKCGISVVYGLKNGTGACARI